MSEYTGGRIVPKHCGKWSSSNAYEPLSVVLYSSTGDSYMSRKAVPAGIKISNTEYWAKCADYSSEMSSMEQMIESVEAETEKLKAQIAENISASTDADADYAAEVADARVDARGETHTSLGERIRNHELAFLCYADEGYYIASGTGVKTKPETTWNGYATGFIACDSDLGNIILESANLLTGNSYIYTIAFYDHNKDFLSGFNSSSDFTVSGGWATFPSSSIPDGACYFRLSLSSAGTSLWVRFQYGGIQEESRQMVAASEKMEEEKAYGQAFNEALSHAGTPCGKNLFNTDSSVFTEGFLDASGNIKANAAYNYRITGYIPVVPGVSYYYSYTTGGAYCCIYDAAFSLVDSFQGPAAVEMPEDGCYVRLTYMPGYEIIFTEEENGTTFQEYCSPYELYQKVEDQAATFDKKLDKIYGKNLFDKDSDEILEGKYLGSSGSISSNSLYFISGYIAVEEGETYYPYNFAAGGAYHCIYASDKATVVGYFKDTAVTIPEGGAYVRLSGVVSAMSSQQFEKGSSYTGYESYTDYAPFEELREEVSDLIGFQPDTKLDKAYGKNLFDKDSTEIIEGKYLGSTGSYGSNSQYFISGFIAVEEGETYCNYGFAVGGAYHCIYASDKSTVVSGFKDTVITIPEGGAYVRLSGVISAMSYQQFEKGDSYTGYEPYTEYYPVLENTQRIETLENNFGTELEVVLPGTLYVCAGVALSIYDENILYKSYHDAADIFCSLAERESRLMNFNLSSAGSGTFEMVVTRGLNKVSTQDFSYEAVDPSANNGKEINLLFIGDSFTDIGTYCRESKDLLEADGAEVTLLGTCGSSTFKAEGLSGGTLSNTFLTGSAGVARVVEVTGVSVAPSTGYPGRTYVDDNGNSWTIRGSKIDSSGNGMMVVTKFSATEDTFADFPESGTLTKTDSSGEGDAVISYSNPVAAYYNPFINPDTGELDISYYLEFWGFENPDVVIFQFTWNDTGLWSDGTAFAKSIKTAVDHVHENLADTKVIISVEPCGSVFSGRDWNGKKYTVLNVVKALKEIFETEDYEEFCKIAPAYACVDLIYGYSTTSVTPNSRYPSVTEISQGDGVHPSTGMYQIADCLYPIITKLTN